MGPRTAVDVQGHGVRGIGVETPEGWCELSSGDDGYRMLVSVVRGGFYSRSPCVPVPVLECLGERDDGVERRDGE